MINSDNLAALVGAEVLDRSDDRIGTISQIYVDPADGHPVFASVRTGLFGLSETFVPLETADTVGDEVHLDYDKEFVKDAPRIDPEGDLTDEQQDELYAYYSTGGFPDTTDYTAGEYSGGMGHTEGTTGSSDFGSNSYARTTDYNTGLDGGMTGADSTSASQMGAQHPRLRKYVAGETDWRDPMSRDRSDIGSTEFDDDGNPINLR